MSFEDLHTEKRLASPDERNELVGTGGWTETATALNLLATPTKTWITLTTLVHRRDRAPLRSSRAIFSQAKCENRSGR
jgi:hypothetical protein